MSGGSVKVFRRIDKENPFDVVENCGVESQRCKIKSRSGVEKFSDKLQLRLLGFLYRTELPED